VGRELVEDYDTVWRAVHGCEGANDERNFGDSGETLLNKLPMVEGRRVRLKARLASRLIGGYRNEGVRVKVVGRTKGRA